MSLILPIISEFKPVKCSGQSSPAARCDHVPACGSATRPVPFVATGNPLAPHPGKLFSLIIHTLSIPLKIKAC
jgi:hypothetical protein